MVQAPRISPKFHMAILSGPIATGKTSIALEFCEKNQIEIINADSLIVYRDLNIGTAKPTEEELKKVRHHLVNICDANEPFSAGDFLREFQSALNDIENRGNRALVVGGTGFYLKALLYGMWDVPPASPDRREELESLATEDLLSILKKNDPEALQKISIEDRYRLIRAIEVYESTGKRFSDLQRDAQKQEPHPLLSLFVIDRAHDELNRRIEERTQAMVQNGIIKETQFLLEKKPHSRCLQAVGYLQTAEFLKNISPKGRKTKPGLEGLTSEIELATRQLVKRQRTWFRAEKASKHFMLDHDRAALDAALKSVYFS